MLLSNTVRGNTVRTAQTFPYYTQIPLNRNTKNSYFFIFFLFDQLTRYSLKVFVEIAVGGQNHASVFLVLLPHDFKSSRE
jgi:hypothetical protein